MAQSSNHIKLHCNYAELFDNNGRSFIIDKSDLQLVDQYYWMVHDKTHGHHKAPQKEVVTHAHNNGKHTIIKLHRLLLTTKHQVDHKNGNALDNRRANLRECTNQENSRNSVPKGGTSKFKGVSRCRQTHKWRATITMNYSMIHIGRFDDEVDAAMAYDKKAIELFGEFAKTNRELGLYG